MGFVSNRSFVLMLVTTSTIFLANAESEYSESSNTKWKEVKPSEVERMYNDSFMSDIKFTFGDKKPGELFYAHKYVLAISSPLFYDMFYSDFYSNTESENAIKTIHLSDHNKETLAGFFGFIYKDDCPTDIEKDFEVLQLMIKYKIFRFHTACRNSLQRNMEPVKAYTFVEKFLDVKAEALAEICLGIIDALADQYFVSKYFLNIKQSTLNILLIRDTLYYNETDIFEAVLKWADYQCSEQNLEKSGGNRRKVLGNAIYSIRFLLMNQTEFTTHVMPTNILHDNETVAIIKAMTGEHVPNLAWEAVKLKSKRLPAAFTATTKKNSWFTWFEFIFFECLIPFITDLMICMGILFCIIIVIVVADRHGSDWYRKLKSN